jgi:hypothetical protein
MGNRFRDLPGYYSLVLGHAILAVIVFLFIVPAAILIAKFYSRSPRLALRLHINLQIMTVLLSTVLFILGFMAVGERRSLTNPHHGIGVALYVLIMVQFLGGAWIHSRERRKGAPVKIPVKLYLHQWLGRAIALLGFAQVPLGLTLYGSPKLTFILYAVWMAFLLVLFFILSYRALPVIGEGLGRSTSYGGSMIEDRKHGRLGGLLGPLAVGAGAAALLGRNRNRSKSRSRMEEVVPSRRGSGSYIDEEKFEESRKKKGGGLTDTLLKGAALVGAAGLAKSWFDRRQRRREDDEYSSVAQNTPSRKHGSSRRHGDSEISESSVRVNRMEQDRRTGPILPGPGDPVVAAAAISAAEPRPVTPRPIRRRDSYDSDDYSYYDSTLSPSRRTQQSHGVRNGLLAGLGLGWFTKKMKDRRDKKELDRQDRLDAERAEKERLARHGGTPARLTGDGFPQSRKQGRRSSRTESSDLSSILDDPRTTRPGGVPSALASTTVTGVGAGANQSRSRHDITESVSMPPAPPDPHGVLHEESGSEAYNSAGGHPHRRHSERRRREGEAAAAIAAAEAASLAAEEEARRRRSRSRAGDPAAASGGVSSPPVSVKMQIHNDKDRHVTLRRLTEQEAAAEREAKRSERRRRRDSLSSLSGTETAASRRRYRREAAEGSGGPGPAPPPPLMDPLSPPNPAFAGGKRPKDSAYYSGKPGEPSASALTAGSGIGSPESHGTWSAMSPSVSGADTVDPAERRRRRRLERNKVGGTPGTVDFT